MYMRYLEQIDLLDKIEDIKEVMKSGNSEDREYNGHQEKDRECNDQQKDREYNGQQEKDREYNGHQKNNDRQNITHTLMGRKYFHTKIFPYIFHIKPLIFNTFSCSHSLSDFHEIFNIKP